MTAAKNVWTYYGISVILFIAFSRFDLAVVDGIIGPTMPDLTHQYNITIEEYSRSLSAKGLVLLIGLPVGGVILDYAYTHIELAFSLAVFIFGVCVGLVPWFGSLIVLGILYGIQGLCYGKVQLFSMVYTVRSYGKEAPWLLSVMGAMFSIGKIMSPFIVGPFITHLNEETEEKNLTFVKTTGYIRKEGMALETIQISNDLITWSNLVFMPFIIVTILSTIVASGFLILFLVKPAQTLNSEAAYEEVKTGITLPARLVIICCFFWIFTLMTTYQIGIEYYLYEIAVRSGLRFSKNEAVALLSVFHIVILTSRTIATVILKYISVKIVYHLYYFLGLLVGVFFAIFGLETRLLFWILAPGASLFIFPLYSIGYAYVDRYIPVTGKVGAIMELGMGLGFIAAAWILAVIYEVYKAQGLLIAFTVIVLMCNILSFITFCIGNHYGDRYDLVKETKQKKNKDVLLNSDDEY